MSPVPRITVITPTHNRAVQLERAVKSVLTQTMGDFEYIVVDDGSTDDTEAKIAALDDPRLIYIRQSWQGANAARNAGIALARADLVTFLDSDDVFLPDRLERTVPLFADEAVELLISSFMTLKNGRLSNSVNRAGRLDGAALERALVAQTIYIAGSAISVRRDTLVAVGSFDPAIARLQDRELLLRLSQRTGCLVSDRIDWQKNNTPNSISGARDGYIPAYDALVSKHPGVFQKYADLAGYMVARNILAHVMSGYLVQGLADYRSTRRSRALNYSLSHLISSYMRGRLQRREIRRQAMGR